MDEMMMSLNSVRYEQDLLSATDTFVTTLDTSSKENKVLLLNLAENGSKQLREFINCELEITDYYCDTVSMKDENGVFRETPRIILIDKERNGYRAMSMTVFKTVQRVISIMGPGPWEEPVVMMPTLTTKGKNQMLSLKIVRV